MSCLELSSAGMSQVAEHLQGNNWAVLDAGKPVGKPIPYLLSGLLRYSSPRSYIGTQTAT